MPEPKIGANTGNRGKGRPKGAINKQTAALKDMILQALDQADSNGGIGYLKAQAALNPTAFLTLVGKVLPLQVAGTGENGEHVHKVIREVVRPPHPNG